MRRRRRPPSHEWIRRRPRTRRASYRRWIVAAESGGYLRAFAGPDAVLLRLLRNGARDGRFGTKGVLRVDVGRGVDHVSGLARLGDGRIAAGGAAHNLNGDAYGDDAALYAFRACRRARSTRASGETGSLRCAFRERSPTRSLGSRLPPTAASLSAVPPTRSGCPRALRRPRTARPSLRRRWDRLPPRPVPLRADPSARRQADRRGHDEPAAAGLVRPAATRGRYARPDVRRRRRPRRDLVRKGT